MRIRFLALSLRFTLTTFFVMSSRAATLPFSSTARKSEAVITSPNVRIVGLATAPFRLQGRAFWRYHVAALNVQSTRRNRSMVIPGSNDSRRNLGRQAIQE